ncbi:putative uncharacterized protein [Clostridium sp. CAG:389]|nr:putative uncharacterized protein [Clostridium sp. CAG:389]
MKIIYIIGKSSVGKDTIYQILKKKMNLKTYVMYTTRPIRTGEKNGIDYYYLKQEEMEKYINEIDSKVMEYRTYNTVYGPWTYATIMDKQFESDNDLLMEGTLESYNAVRMYFENDKKINVIPIYIEVDDGIRLERALKREKEQENPKYEELCRRFLADSQDFSEEKIEESGIEKRFQNINLDDCVKEIIEYIKSR